MLLEIHNWCMWLDCNMGSSQKFKFCVLFVTGGRLCLFVGERSAPLVR